ncbi:unnamed protein product [Cylindrotheca closterium]|uniref:Uncharacterized protein n=1 Tax=Cylindrotheca closterium TaxID=2856 RepID=A0AAD2G395_9STRA|nr:unnamed protein product [Cylindrotheca closterium]
MSELHTNNDNHHHNNEYNYLSGGSCILRNNHHDFDQTVIYTFGIRPLEPLLDELLPKRWQQMWEMETSTTTASSRRSSSSNNNNNSDKNDYTAVCCRNDPSL